LDFIKEFRRLADAHGQGMRFAIQNTSERISDSVRAIYKNKQQWEGGEEEMEFQIK